MFKARPTFVILLLFALAAYGLREAGQGTWIEDGRVKGLRPAVPAAERERREPTPAGTEGSNIRRSEADRDRDAFFRAVQEAREKAQRRTMPDAGPDTTQRPMPRDAAPEVLAGGFPPVPQAQLPETGGGGSTIYDSIFYLSSVDTDADTVTVGSGSVAIAGVWKSVSGLTDQAISGNTYIYVAVERTDSGGTATMTNSVGSLPNGDDDTEVFPLWYIPYSGGITTSGIKDYRFTKHWMADS